MVKMFSLLFKTNNYYKYKKFSKKYFFYLRTSVF